MALEDLSAKGAMIHAWVRANTTPELQAMLQQRRDESVVFARRLLDEAAAAGELPAWVDRDAVASAFITLTNGFIVLANSGAIGPERARREAYAILELLLAAPAELPAAVTAIRGAAPAR
jgi:hypothetical protein